jgi:hypothetical protein
MADVADTGPHLLAGRSDASRRGAPRPEVAAKPFRTHHGDPHHAPTSGGLFIASSPGSLEWDASGRRRRNHRTRCTEVCRGHWHVIAPELVRESCCGFPRNRHCAPSFRTNEKRRGERSDLRRRDRSSRAQLRRRSRSAVRRASPARAGPARPWPNGSTIELPPRRALSTRVDRPVRWAYTNASRRESGRGFQAPHLRSGPTESSFPSPLTRIPRGGARASRDPFERRTGPGEPSSQPDGCSGGARCDDCSL